MSEVFLIILFYLFAKLSLDVMQIRTIKTAKVHEDYLDMFKISPEDEEKSRNYNISKLKLSIFRNIIFVSWMIYLSFGGLVSEIVTLLESTLLSTYLINLLTILIAYMIVYLSMLPIAYISTFIIEEKYEFNTSTKKLFLKDSFVSTLMSLILITIISSVFLFIVPYQNTWWFMMALTIFILTILSIYIYPNYIAPLFNKFKKLDNDDVRNEIEELSIQTDFDIKNLYIADKSKRTKHPNAYFTGFKNNRRIVFYDTLIDLLSPREIKAVLAHEIGHYKHNHITKSLVISTAVIFIGMFLLSYLVNSYYYLDLLNLPQNDAAKLIALVFTYQVVSFFIDPFFSILSRKNEYEADSFASKQVDKEYLITSLIKLYKSNLSFLIPNKLYATFYFSHPTVIERINNLRSSDG
tara:strand:- start:38 stop:1264 length:1227 start_codon:yes stop_codon:yes gene_type:complete